MSGLAGASIAALTDGQPAVTGPIGVNAAIARALRFNLDHQVELAEHAVRERELDLAHYSLLPNLTANAGHAARNRFNASSSRNVLTGVESLATSTSQDKELDTRDVSFGWNILDFGLSYVRARQAADKALIQNELRRKVTLRIVEDTRSAFWRALSAQRLLGELKRVEDLARSVGGEARKIAQERQSSPITALTYEREVVEIQRTAGELARELVAAKAALAALLNIPPGTPFTLSGHAPRRQALPAGDIQSLINNALTNRPELKEVVYRRRINEHELHAAMLELLPGLNLYAAANYDSNSFLLDNHWKSWGARASWNLLRVFSYPAKRSVVEAQDKLLETKALAVTMAIATQVHVARIRYAHAAKEHATALRYADVQRRLLRQIRAEASADRVSRQTLAREELNAVVAEAKLDIAAAQMSSAFALVQSSMGLTPIPDEAIRELAVRDWAERTRLARSDGPH